MTVIIGKLTSSERIFGVRHFQVLLMFFNTAIAYFLRISASVAVVAMTNKDTTNPNFEEFSWTIQEKSLILSSFYWAYTAIQFPSGWVAQRYGAKFIFLSSTFAASILGIFVPIVVNHGGYKAYCAIRVLQGLSQGFIFPTLHAFLAKWSPSKERNLLGGVSLCGVEVGTILAFTASGYIAGSSAGWPGIYYISGGLGILWSLIWAFFGANSPHECKYISAEEKKFIELSLQTNDETEKENLTIPWKDIYVSIPFIALIITRTGQAWGFTTLMNEIPKYMRGVLKMNIQENALFSGLPYVSMLIVSVIAMTLANFLTQKTNVSMSVIRKSFNSIALYIPAIALIGLNFITKEQTTFAVVLIIITVGINGMHTIGSYLNHIDLSPNYAPILLGITNTLENCVAIVAPLIFSVIVDNESDAKQWNTVFYTVVGTFLIGNTFFLIFGQTTLQYWNDSKTHQDQDIEKRISANKNVDKEYL